MHDATHIVVAGAGYVGKALVENLLQSGHDPTLLTALVHSDESVAALQATGINIIQEQLDRPLVCLPLPSPCDIVYLVPPSRFYDIDYRLKNFLDEVQADVRKLIYISTTGVYGDHNGARVDESTPPKPETPRAVRRADAESRVQGFCHQRNCKQTILRVPGIYGPSRLPLKLINFGGLLIHPDEAGPGNRIHRDDLARIISYTLFEPGFDGVINVGDGDHMSTTDFVLEVARQTGSTPPSFTSRESMRATCQPRRWTYLKERRLVDTTKLQQLLPEPLLYRDPVKGIATSLKGDSDDSPATQ